MGVIRDVITSMSVRPDGSVVPADTQRHRKNTLVSVIGYAFDATRLRPEFLWRAPRSAEEFDPRRVINPGLARSLLVALSYVGPYGRARGRRLVGFFAGMYYAGLRPEEAVVVRYQDCELPSDGWGRLVVHEARPQTTKKYTDSGRSHDERGLKRRKRGAVRVVPLPPQLVALWRESFDTFGTAEDGRLFFTERKRILGSSGYCKTWHDARVLALPPDLGGFATGQTTLRPAPLGTLDLAQRRRRSHGGRRAGGQHRRACCASTRSASTGDRRSRTAASRSCWTSMSDPSVDRCCPRLMAPDPSPRPEAKKPVIPG